MLFLKDIKALNCYTPAHWTNIYLDLGDKKWENLLIQSSKNRKNQKSKLKLI